MRLGAAGVAHINRIQFIRYQDQIQAITAGLDKKR
jgi:hypothetical protein